MSDASLEAVAQREHPANQCKDCEVGEPHMCPRASRLDDLTQTMREAAVAVEESRIEAARLALYDYLRAHPAAHLGEISAALVPKRPFDDTHLSSVLIEDLSAGRLHLTVDMGVAVAEVAP